MKAAIYCRVSTEEQGKEGTSLESQQIACLKKAADLGYEAPEALIFRETYSGLSLDRPLLSQLRNKAREGEFGSVVAYSPDRLSRVGEDILSLAKELKLAGIKLIFVKEQWDDTLNGKLIAFTLGWASEFEAQQIKERTVRGKHTLVSRGILPQGTGIGLYGYSWDKKQKKRVAIDFEARVVDKIFTMIADGNSRFQVAKTLNEQGIPSKSGGKWHPLTIQRIIANPVYIGKTYFGRTSREGKRSKLLPEDKWAMLPDTTPAIIKDQLFERANRVLKLSRELHRGRPQHDYLLTGHIRCGYCNNHLVGSCLNHKYRYYHCRGAYPTSVRGAICRAGYIRAGEAEEIVWNKVREVIEHPQVILADLQRRIEAQNNGDGHKVEDEIAAIRQRLESYHSQEKRLVKLFRHDGINEDAVTSELAQLKSDRQEDETCLAQLTKIKEQTVDLASVETQLNEFCQKIKQSLDNCTLQTKRLALDILDVQVIATPEKLDIKAVVPLEFITIEQTSA
jgi:site-specific DNA recombinase